MRVANIVPGALAWVRWSFILLASGTILMSALNVALNLDLLSVAAPLLDEGAVRDSGLSTIVDSKEQHLAMIQMPRLAIGIATLLAWFVWLYCAAKLLRLCKIDGLEFRPIMTIVWHFIPVMNLWKPLQINIELANASKGGSDWRDVRPSGLTMLTSFLGVCTGLMGRANYELSNKIETVADAVFAIRFGVALELVVIASMILAILFVLKTSGDQKLLLFRLTGPQAIAA